jgi:hypothetical protein
MPIKIAQRTAPAYQHYKQISYENLAASWFTADGWEVFMPVTDHDRKTDLVVRLLDGAGFYPSPVSAFHGPETKDCLNSAN